MWGPALADRAPHVAHRPSDGPCQALPAEAGAGAVLSGFSRRRSGRTSDRVAFRVADEQLARGMGSRVTHTPQTEQ